MSYKLRMTHVICIKSHSSGHGEFTADTEVSINDRFGNEDGTVHNRSLWRKEVKITMQSTILLCFAALVSYSYADYRLPGLDQNDFFKDLYFQRNLARGQVFGGLGANDAGLFGRGGYQADVFNDHRGRLQGQAYGERVLGTGGDSSVLGSKFKWNNANDNVRAALDVHKEIGKSSGMTLTGDGVWKVDKNTRLVAGGIVDKTFGHEKPQLGLEAKIEHDF